MDVHDNYVDSRDFHNPLQKNKKSATVPTGKYDMFYNTNHKKIGVAVIFNHEYFDSPMLEQRKGTEQDCLNLEKTLNNLGFETTKYLDLSCKEIEAVIEELGNRDFSEYDCLFIAVLSHGGQDVIYAKNSAYSSGLLTNRFTPDRVPTLAGKPKIFVIQACRGEKLDEGVNVKTIEVDCSVNSKVYTIPLFADYIVAYSTIPGYYSWRNPRNGSWFIQAFCNIINKHWQEYDFLTMLTLVSGRVAVHYESFVPTIPAMHRQKEIPCVTSMLTRVLKLNTKTGA